MEKKIHGFNLCPELHKKMSDKLESEIESGKYPPRASMSWIVSTLIERWVNGDVTVP